jgi:hypothetical protein
MNRYAVSVGRVAMWAAALVVGALAAAGLSNLAPVERTTSLVWIVGPVVAFGFTSACVVAAVESLIPALRRGVPLRDAPEWGARPD